MGEFGHHGIKIAGLGYIDSWGSGPFVITAGDKSFRFEDSDRFGPSLIKKNGDISQNPFPPQNSPFWKAHRLWRRQGRRTAPDGVTCIYDDIKPKPTIYRRLGKELIVIEHGDEDGEMIEISSLNP